MVFFARHLKNKVEESKNKGSGLPSEAPIGHSWPEGLVKSPVGDVSFLLNSVFLRSSAASDLFFFFFFFVLGGDFFLTIVFYFSFCLLPRLATMISARGDRGRIIEAEKKQNIRK